MNKKQHYIDVRGEVLPTPCGTTTAVATSNNLEKRILLLNLYKIAIKYWP